MKMKSLVRGSIALIWLSFIFAIPWISTWSPAHPQRENRLLILGWPDQFSPELIRQFEKEMGVRVTVHPYGTDGEFLVKFKSHRGRGYDLVMASDYAIPQLIKSGWLKPLDYSQLDFIPTLDTRLLGLGYDDNNLYSLPYQWEVYLFGVDWEVFRGKEVDWDWGMLFPNPPSRYMVGMLNEPIDAIAFAAYYLYGPRPTLHQKQVERIEEVLREQKKCVESYTSRTDHLLMTKSCPFVVNISSPLLRATTLAPHIKAVMPKGWSFLAVENICIPKTSSKDHLIYAFLNYLYRPSTMGREASYYGTFPATTNVSPFLQVSHQFKEMFAQANQRFDHLYLIQHLIPEEEGRHMWVRVKAK